MELVQQEENLEGKLIIWGQHKNHNLNMIVTKETQHQNNWGKVGLLIWGELTVYLQGKVN